MILLQKTRINWFILVFMYKLQNKNKFIYKPSNFFQEKKMQRDLSIKIGRHKFKYPIIQGGMGVGISLKNLPIFTSLGGGVPVVALIGTCVNEGIFNPTAKQLTSRESIYNLVRQIRTVIGNSPLFCNIMYALSDYDNIVKAAIDAGFDGIISGAGLPISLPGLLKEYPNVAMVPIVSNARVLRLLMHQWKKHYKKVILPDAVILEGPLAGGHLGFKVDDLKKPEMQLENTLLELLQLISDNKWDIPVFPAGGIINGFDSKKYINMGGYGVQVGTRFLLTHQSDASDYQKQLLIQAKDADIIIGDSPAGYPCRKVFNPLWIPQTDIKCKANCLTNCKLGEAAKKIQMCISKSLIDGFLGKPEGLYMTGARAGEIHKLLSVEEVIQDLISQLWFFWNTKKAQLCWAFNNYKYYDIIKD